MQMISAYENCGEEEEGKKKEKKLWWTIRLQNLYLKMENCRCDKPCIELEVVKVISFLNLKMFLSIVTIFRYKKKETWMIFLKSVDIQTTATLTLSSVSREWGFKMLTKFSYWFNLVSRNSSLVYLNPSQEIPWMSLPFLASWADVSVSLSIYQMR